jgi:nuclear cap-binding protein subunit 1
MRSSLLTYRLLLDTRHERSKEAHDAQTSLDIQSSKLEKVLLATTKHFVASLIPWTFDPLSTSQGLKAVLTLLDAGEEGWWGIRARWGWYKEFVRLYRIHLTPLEANVEEHVFGGMDKGKGKEESVGKRAEWMVRQVWEAALGVEE